MAIRPAFRPAPLLTFALAFVPAAALAANRQPAARPNVIVVLTDDQGYGDVGIHGNEHINTPRLDRFAAAGVQMKRFYTSPVCAPTRACLLTGRYYYRTGVIHTSRGGAKMHADETTLAEMLAAAGYAAGIFGKWHLGDTYPMRPQDQGFAQALVHKSGGIGQTPDQPNSYFNPLLWRNGRRVQSQGYCTDVFFRAAEAFIEQHRDQPFFVYLPANAPHTPLEIADRYVEPYRKQGLDETTAKVYGMVANIDENFGRLLDKLDELKLRDNTLLVFLGDNGPQQKRYTAGLRGRKSWVYEGGIRAPCFIQWPARLAGARDVSTIAAHIDLAPTILDACGIQPPQSVNFDGASILPLLQGDAQDWPDRTLFFQCHRGLAPKKFQNCAAITQRYKLVGNPGTFGREDLDPSQSPVLELYDIAADEGEQHNLAAEQPRVLSRLRAAYETWFADVQSTRRFQPGLIQLGGPAENPTRLCRYQDGNYTGGNPHGWTIEILRTARYQLTINRAPAPAAGSLHVVWQGKQLNKPLAANQTGAVFNLPAGRGVIDIWFQERDQPRTIITDNSTLGDVDVLRLE